MSKFKVGDYILYEVGNISGMGQILRIEDEGELAVKFNVRNDNYFHDLGGLCEDRYGYWVHPKDAKKVVADTKINKALYSDYEQKDGFLIER
jgi:hypothetical protein